MYLENKITVAETTAMEMKQNLKLLQPGVGPH